MILKCIHCNGMMKVDDGVIPKAGPVKVRCPHCQAIEPVSGMKEVSSEPQRAPAAPRPNQATAPGSPEPERQAAAPTPQRPKQPEPQVPKDAFQSFRFPAEKEQKKAARAPATWRKWLLVWGGISLAVVIFFALLVNILLRAPSGTRLRSGDIPDEPATTAPADRAKDTAGQRGASRPGQR